MRTGQTRHVEVCARRAHRVSIMISVDGVDWIKITVDEKHRADEVPAIGRPVSISDVGIVVEVPSAGWSEAVSTEQLGRSPLVAREPGQVA